MVILVVVSVDIVSVEVLVELHEPVVVDAVCVTLVMVVLVVVPVTLVIVAEVLVDVRVLVVVELVVLVVVGHPAP